MSPIVLSKEKRRHNTKTKQKFYVTIVLSKEKKTIPPKQKFYVTHCISREKRRP